MPIHKKYQIIDTLHENNSTIVYRALRLADKKSVIIKTIKKSVQNEKTIGQFLNEEKILKRFKSNNIIKLLEVLSSATDYIHVFEDIHASSLFDLLSQKKFTLSETLDIALSLCKAVSLIHKNKVLHLDINPKNIIYNPDTKALQIIDFAQSSINNRVHPTENINQNTFGNLFYMSPEQTGLTNIGIDNRTDLYSLGMTLYYLFLGKVPFEGKDRYELIHKQIASNPPPLSSLKSDIPDVLSRIISKLIQKRPEERYQDDQALVHDIAKCVKTITSKAEIKDFEIARHDHVSLNIGEHLYGRKKEVELLKDAADKINTDVPINILISGHSGVGKTRLIEEFFTYLHPHKTIILRAKFDKYQTSVPYLSFKQLFLQLHTILMSQNSILDTSKISKESAGILNFTFSELKDLLPSSTTFLHSEIDINTQLALAISEFFTYIAHKDAHLMIFIDDLQWADPASLFIIEKAIISANNPYLHFTGSFRDTQINENTYAKEIVNTFLNDKEKETCHLKVLPLGEDEVKQMLKDLLSSKGKNLNLLSAIVYKKTDGNPFYIKTFIEALIAEKELVYSKGEWQYSLEAIQSYSSSINIVAIINKKFNKLSKNQQYFLQHLAILGNRFELNTSLEMLYFFRFSQEQMQEAQEKGFIDCSLGQYQFAHDQIQEYVFNSIDEKDKRCIHRNIGQYLEKAYKDRSFSDIVYVVDHLNSAYEQGNFSKKLFRLNVLALEEMLKNNEYLRAMEKVVWIKENLYDPSLWKTDHANAFNFRLLSVKSYYLSAAHETAFKEINLLIKDLDNTSEKIRCFTLLKDICVTQGKHFNELIDLASTLFNSLGLYLPSNKAAISTSLLQLQAQVSNHTLFEHPSNILKLKKMQNVKMERIPSLLVHFWEVAYYLADLDLMQWAYLNIVTTSFKYGNSKESSFGYVLYGGQLISQGEYKKAAEFGNIALRLNHTFDDKEMLPKVHNFVANFINPYTKTFSSNTVLYQKSLHQSKINGDIIFGTWANFLMHFSDFLAGTTLEELKEKIASENDFILHSGDVKMISIFKILLHTVENLHDDNEYTYLEDDETSILLWEKENFYPALSWYGIIKAQSSFLYGRFDEGLEYLQSYVRKEDNEVIMFSKIHLHFLRALLLMGKKDSLSPDQKRTLDSDLTEFDSFSKATPRNFKFRKLLLKAEAMKHTESVWDVAKIYDRCLEESHKLKNPFYTSLVSLCASRFFKKPQFNDLTNIYFNEAIAGLKQWGAFHLAKELKLLKSEEEKKQEKDLHNESSQNSLSHSSSSNTENTNMQSLLKSFNAISKALDSKELIQTLMKLIVQNATASKAVLIFNDNNNFKVKAQIDFKRETVDLFDDHLSEATILPLHLVSYVINTSQKLNLHNPSESGKFQLDPYIKKYQPVSCLVLPVLLEGSIQAILYLENKDIITPLAYESIKTLELLLIQAAIVFKNTSLYESIKHSEDNLTKAQEISNVGSWEFNSRTQKIAWSAQTYRIYGLEPFSIDIDYEWFTSHLHQDDVQHVSNAVEKALEGERYYDISHRIVTSKGEIRQVHQRAQAYYEGDIQKMSGTIQDITDYEEAKEEISRLSQVVYQGPYSTLITDINGHIEYVNEQTLHMTGYSKDELLGKYMNIFRSGIHDEALYKTMWKTIKEDKDIWRGTLFNKMKNNTVLDCYSTIFPILNEKREITNFVTIQEDVTAQNIKEKLFLMQSRQAQMGEMLSMIAHQWRQPLSIITALTNSQRIRIMLETSTTEDVLQNYSDIEDQVSYLSNTITDFRDFFKPDKVATNTKSSVIVSKVLKLLRHALKQDKISVKTHYLKDTGYKTFEHEMEQVILNIFKNAQDAFKERKIEKPMLDVTCDEIDGDALIIIEDNAKGINKEVIDTLFLPYISTKDQKHGTGLGLYMSKTIVEEHCRGKIMVENTAQGARFSIRIPLKDLNE